MIYTNSTGKFIGECMTGFGINYPVYIYNSGNSEVAYTMTSSDSNFLLSDSQLIIANGNSDHFDILFNPTSNGVSGYETASITISSESTEDGSVDPSGSITIYATGHRIVDTTGGHVRNFRALKNYDPEKGLSYSFYWRPPTGTGYLNNRFVTGWGLDIATDTSFSTKVVSKTYNVPQNNSIPVFSTYYGFPDEDIFRKVEAYDDGSQFVLDQSYYARMYTWVDNVTGESVYATGINQLDTQVSNEVLTGNMSNKVNLIFTKNALDVYISPRSIYTNYNLYNQIISQNKGNNNFKYISGINVYLPDLTTFTADDESLSSLNLQGQLKNFSGNSTYGTNINIYLSETTKLLGYAGKGGDLKGSIEYPNEQNQTTYSFENLFSQTQAAYSQAGSNITDCKNGGSVFNFEIVSNIDKEYTDINYNVISKCNSALTAGGGGSKALVAWIYGNGAANVGGIDKNKNSFRTVFPIFGSPNDKGATSYTVYETKIGNNMNIVDGKQVFAAIIAGSSFGTLSSWPHVYGEQGQLYPILKVTSKAPNLKYDPSFFGIDTGTIANTKLVKPNSNFVPQLFFNPINQNQSSAGKILNGFSNIKTNFTIDSGNVASDYVFRFENSAIDSGASNWKDTTTTATLAGTVAGGIFNNDYLGTGLKSVTLNGSQYVQYQFSASNTEMIKKNCNQFDLYMVVAYKPITKDSKFTDNQTYITSKFKLLDWSSNPTINTIDNQILIKAFPYNTDAWYYKKERNVFEFFVNPLFNHPYKNTEMGAALWWNVTGIANNNYIQLSKSLLNAVDYYPMLINIKRTNSIYSVYVNGNLIVTYNMGSFVEFADSYITSLIENTTLKLISNCTTAGESMSYFDIVFYNRLLNVGENQQLNNSLLNSYFKLFTGGSSSVLNLKANQIRLPNAFNLAGKAL
jgi:hypothetical protein